MPSSSGVLRSVLIVDDDPADVFIARFFLESSSRVRFVLDAPDGEDAHRLYEQEGAGLEPVGAWPPSLILLDVNMPRVDGVEFLRRLRDSAAHLPPVVLVSGLQLTAAQRMAIQTEFPSVAGWLAKPISRSDVDDFVAMFGETG